MLFYKHLEALSIPEDDFLTEITDSGKKIWFTAKKNESNGLNFVKSKTNAGFYLSKLKNFPNISRFISDHIKNANLDNSYVTRCHPRYIMEKHIDANRKTAIIIPLGSAKGILNFYCRDFLISRCAYQGPTLCRVDVVHSAINTSDEYRYSITVEIAGSYLYNFFMHH